MGVKKAASVWKNLHTGSIKRTRSIKVSDETEVEGGVDGAIGRRPKVAIVATGSTGSATGSGTPDSRSDTPAISEVWRKDPLAEAVRQRFESESCYQDQEVSDLVAMLTVTSDLEEQGDILHYMVLTYGMEFKTDMTGPTGQKVTVGDLVQDLYQSACKAKHWSIVRHASGLLCKKLPDLAKSVTDLIVRQKQVTVGLPPDREVIINRPLGASELRLLIAQAHAGDISTCSLSQEILIFLAMFIRTEPQLFHGMLRLRVGLIIQVMASELARSLGISGDEVADKLLNLS